jgi:hypothetical protein
MQVFSEGLSRVEGTQILKAWGCGDNQVIEQRTPVVDRELRRLVYRCGARGNPGHSADHAAARMNRERRADDGC